MSNTIGDLKLSLLVEVAQAEKNVKSVSTSLEGVEKQTKKTNTELTSFEKTLGRIRAESLAKTNQEITKTGTVAKTSIGQVSILDQALGGLGASLKVSLIIVAMELLNKTLKKIFEEVSDRFKEYQDNIDKTTDSISISSAKIATLTYLQSQYQNYSNLSTQEQESLNSQLGKAVQLYPDIVAGITSYNGVLNINSDTIQNVIDRENNLIKLRRELLVSDQVGQIKNIIEQNQSQITSIEKMNTALADNGKYLRDNILIFNAFGEVINVIYDADKSISKLKESLIKAKSEVANLQIKFLDAIQQGLKFGDIDAVLSQIKLEIGGNTSATKLFFDTIAQLTGQGINNWDALRNALVNYKNELASITNTQMLPESPTPNVLSKRINELRDLFNNESDATKRKSYSDDIKAIQRELDKMNGTVKTSSSTNSTGTTKAKEFISYLAELSKQLTDINQRIANQDEGQNITEGLFGKKKDIEDTIKQITELNKLGVNAYITQRALKDIDRIKVPEKKWGKLYGGKPLTESDSSDPVKKSVKTMSSEGISAAMNISSILGLGADHFISKLLSGLNDSISLVSSIAQIFALFGGGASGGIFKLLGFASGGSVPGGSDTIPAMLTPGEFVIKKSIVDKLGSGFLDWINGGGMLQRLTGRNSYYATGGMVTNTHIVSSSPGAVPVQAIVLETKIAGNDIALSQRRTNKTDNRRKI